MTAEGQWMEPTPHPLILTLLMETGAQTRFEAMRRAHFPPERNIVPAHLTLFHHLPGPQAREVAGRIHEVCRQTPAFDVHVPTLRFLGYGSAYVCQSRELADLHALLADGWHECLIPQDRAAFRPHVTIANKLPSPAAKALHARLTAEFAPFSFGARGLRLWRYDAGPWSGLGEWRFRQ